VISPHNTGFEVVLEGGRTKGGGKSVDFLGGGERTVSGIAVINPGGNFGIG